MHLLRFDIYGRDDQYIWLNTESINHIESIDDKSCNVLYCNGHEVSIVGTADEVVGQIGEALSDEEVEGDEG